MRKKKEQQVEATNNEETIFNVKPESYIPWYDDAECYKYNKHEVRSIEILTWLNSKDKSSIHVVAVYSNNRQPLDYVDILYKERL